MHSIVITTNTTPRNNKDTQDGVVGVLSTESTVLRWRHSGAGDPRSRVADVSVHTRQCAEREPAWLRCRHVTVCQAEGATKSTSRAMNVLVRWAVIVLLVVTAAAAAVAEEYSTTRDPG